MPKHATTQRTGHTWDIIRSRQEPRPDRGRALAVPRGVVGPPHEATAGRELHEQPKRLSEGGGSCHTAGAAR